MGLTPLYYQRIEARGWTNDGKVGRENLNQVNQPLIAINNTNLCILLVVQFIYLFICLFMGLTYASQWFSQLSSLTLTRLSSSSSHSFSLFNRNYTQRKVITNFSPKRQLQRPTFKTMASSTQVADATAKQDKITAPYGSWKSPITADVVSGASKRLGGIAVDDHGHLFWVESRPSESG